MRWFYNLFIYLYPLFARLFALGNRKADLWVKGRKNIFKRIAQSDFSGDVMWFHCASLGEFEQGRPLLEYIKQQHPTCKILLTFFSPSGYEVRKDYPPADYIFYLPNDTPANAARFLRLVRPKKIFFIKYEFWFNYIRQAYRMGIPFYSVSCIFRKKQVFFAWYGVWFRRQLKMITHFFTQDDPSADLLASIGIKRITVTGDTRFDRVIMLAQDSKSFPVFERFARTGKIIVAGSTWQADERLLAALLSNPNIKLIIAPHEVNTQRIDFLKKIFSRHKICLYSDPQLEENLLHARVLIIDAIGILSYLYPYGKLAYIGGGFGRGIHNILEAATYGRPIIFGTNYHKFKEARDLIDQQAAFSIADADSLCRLVEELFNNDDKLMSASQVAASYVIANNGTCQRIYREIN